MTDQYAELRAAAEAATPGPWRSAAQPESTRFDAVYSEGGGKVAYCQALFGRPHVPTEQTEHNAAFIALANPETVKTILSKRDALAERVRVLEGALMAVREIIAEGAPTGFNPMEGDWADRLFRSQAVTHRALTSSPLVEGGR